MTSFSGKTSLGGSKNSFWRAPLFAGRRLKAGALVASILLAALACGLALATPLSAQPSVNNPMPDLAARRRALAERMEAATFWIVVVTEDGLSTGSGFLVGEGRIITNGHVVATDGPSEIYILNDIVPVTEARLIAIDYEPSEDQTMGGRDFALLAFDSGRYRSLPVLSFNLEARKMDLVGAWGFPEAVMQFDRNYQELLSGNTSSLKAPSMVFTEGTVSALVDAELGTVIMHSASVSSGNSGGPLVNMVGEVVGINTQRYARREDLAVLNIALGANDIVAFLVDCGLNPSLSEGQTLASLKPRSSSPPSRSRRSSPGSQGSGRKAAPRDDGQTRSMASFSLKVPSGWGVIFEEDDSIVLGTHDLSTSMWIMVADNESFNLDEVAEFYSLLLNGSTPKSEEDGVYVFTGTDENGSPNIVVVSELENSRHLMVSVSGDPDEPGVEVILNSLEER